MSYPYQTPPPAAGYGNYQVSQPGRGMAIAALVLGILAILSTWIPVVGLFLMVLSLAAIVVGIIALVQVSSGRARGRGMALTGLILGVLSVVTSILMHVLVFKAVDSLVNEVSSSISSASAAAPTSGTSGESPATGGGATKSEAGADVSLGTPSGSTGVISVPVTVTNTSSERASFSINVEAVKDGNVATSAPVMAVGLEPGASTTETAMLIAGGEDLSDATYQVGEVTSMNFGVDMPSIPSAPIPTQS